MVVSWRFTVTVFPLCSGRWVFTAFAFVTIAAVALGLIEQGRPPAWLPTLQSLLLMILAYGLFGMRGARM